MTLRLVDHLKALGHGAHGARELLRTGKVRVDGWVTADAARPVEPGRVVVDPSAPRVVVGRDALVVWHDAHLLVVAKPSGMLSVAAPGRHDEATVVGSLARRFGEAFTVHRLDEGTSGLMVVARSARVRDLLKEQFAAHTVERVYVAFVRGRPLRAAWTVDSTLVRDAGDGRRGSGPGGERAVTHLSRVGPLGDDASAVHARLETGRTHQVRIHLSEAGHPVLGDTLYGRGGPVVPRLALHACVLGFRHPVEDRPLRWMSPLADDLAAWARGRGADPELLLPGAAERIGASGG